METSADGHLSFRVLLVSNKAVIPRVILLAPAAAKLMFSLVKKLYLYMKVQAGRG